MAADHIQEIRDLKLQLEQAQAKLKKKEKMTERGVFFRVSPKGGISVYGFGKYPITYYANQWLGLFKYADEIREFILDNRDNIKTRGEL